MRSGSRAVLALLALLALLAANVVSAVDLRGMTDPVAAQNAEVPRISCAGSLSKEQELIRGRIGSRLQVGNVHAAYAEVLTLPSDQAQVAILRAEILRRLERPEAAAWYQAMQKGCMAGQAEHGLGLLAAYRGDHARALQHLLAASRLLPTDARVRNDAGYVFMVMARDQQAEFELRVASELAPEVRLPAFNLMLLTLLRGDQSGWVEWREKLKPDAREVGELARECQRLHRQRLLAAGAPAPADVMCPLLPRLAAATAGK